MDCFRALAKSRSRSGSSGGTGVRPCRAGSGIRLCRALGVQGVLSKEMLIANQLQARDALGNTSIRLMCIQPISPVEVVCRYLLAVHREEESNRCA